MPLIASLMTKMSQLSFKEVLTGDMRGWVSEDILKLLPQGFFEDPVRSAHDMGGSVIKESRRRWAAILTLPNGQRVFLKRDQTRGWFESFKFLLLPSKGRKEWLIADGLQKKNLNVPRPLGWMEKTHRGFVKESYYLSEAVGSGTSFIDDPLKSAEGSSIDELAEIVREIHDSGLFHRDLHAGNFLWDGQSIFLTDLHRGEIIRSLSLKQRLWNLSQLFHSLRSVWGEGERLRFVEKYFKEGPLSRERREVLFQKINSLMVRLQERQWRSRAKRCLKESTEFSVKKEKGVHTYHRRDFPLDHLKKVIEDHLRWVKEKPSMLAKYSPEIIVSILKDGEKKISVKQFRYPHFWDVFKEHFRRSKGLRAWLAGNGLKARGIPSLLPLAFVERKNWLGLIETFLVMEVHEMSRELDRYILEGFKDVREKRRFIKTFARWLSHLHRTSLYHKDMKTCNILVSAEGEKWEFRLLDLEDVRLGKRVGEKGVFRNLLQLNTSIPNTISGGDRLRFFREYTRLHPIIKNRRVFLSRLFEKSRERGVVYVSSKGVIKEKAF